MPDLFETLALIRLTAIAGERAPRRPAAAMVEEDDARPWGRRHETPVGERPHAAVRRPRPAGSTLGA